ncbi:MAG TPA: hypothetical protein PLQ35_06200 [bacterium]|nr:hypothetical protein [bacterium]HQL61868.1 hypothetical protein [bacterium]
MRTRLILFPVLFHIIGMGYAEVCPVGNNFLQRDIVIDRGIIRTTAIRNLIADRVIPVTGEEFVLSIAGLPELKSSDFHWNPMGAAAISAGPHGVLSGWVGLMCDACLLSATISYNPETSTPYLRKTVTITNNSNHTRVLRRLEVEHLTLGGEPLDYSANPQFPSLTDYGQPVLYDSVWTGLEHPAANTAVDQSGTLFLRQHPGIELKPGQSYTSYPAVMGAAARGEARDAFETYVEHVIKYYSGPPRVFFWWNGFRVIKPPDRLSQGLAMAQYLVDKLEKPYGKVFDAFSYDAGFDMYRPEGLWVPTEENIWDETLRVLKGSPTGLGFWASFSCVFDTSTHDWGKTQGFGLHHPKAYCLAEPIYHGAAKARLLEIVRKYDMRVISFDGMYLGQGYGCNTPGHGHWVSDGPDAGKYGTEAVVNAELDIFHAIRQIQPDIDIDFFVCGEWVSPWWLTVVDGVHSVPGDTVGTHIISPALRDELITARDIQCFELHRNQRRPFPLWAEDLYGFQVRKDHLIDGVTAVNEDYTEKWENEYVLGLAGRGTITSFIACSDLPLLGTTPTGMRFLADVHRWVCHNREIYRHTRWVLGDPNKAEVCGYAHGNRDNRSLVAIHNPSIETREVSLEINSELDLKHTGKPFVVNMIYPHRYHVADAAWNESVAFPIYGYEVILLDIRREPVSPGPFPDLVESPLTEPGVQVSRPSLQSGKITVAAMVDIPESHTSSNLLVYLRPSSTIRYGIKATINGEETSTTIRSRSRTEREEAWFQVPLVAGANQIRIELSAGDQNQIGSWICSTLPAPPEIHLPESEEPLFPILPPDYRKQYRPVHPLEAVGRGKP